MPGLLDGAFFVLACLVSQLSVEASPGRFRGGLPSPGASPAQGADVPLEHRIRVWRERLATLESRRPAGSPEVLRLREDVARGLLRIGRPELAIAHLEALVAIWRRLEGMVGPVTADLLLLLGSALNQVGRKGEALEALRRSLIARIRLFGPRSREVHDVQKALERWATDWRSWLCALAYLVRL